MYSLLKTTLDTAPALEPISVTEVKDHTRIDRELAEEDELLRDYIIAATRQVEAWTGRKLITQTWLLYLDAWPAGDAIILPYPPLSSVTSVTYYDTDGAASTFAATDYDVDTDTEPGRIVLKWGESWPSETLQPKNPIKVEFICGYGANGADVPADIRHAIKLLVGEFNKEREISIVGAGITTTKQQTIDWLIQTHRVWHWNV